VEQARHERCKKISVWQPEWLCPACVARRHPPYLLAVEQPRTSAAAEQGGTSTQTRPESGVPPDAHADTSHVTAEEVAAVLGDVGDLGGGADTEDGEDDGIEWEDADVATEPRLSAQRRTCWRKMRLPRARCRSSAAFSMAS